MRQIAVRLDPGDAGFLGGRPTGTAKIDGWFALADEEPVDAFGLLLASDAFPPAASFRSRFVENGMLDEEGELWDASGALVAQCRQLALMPRG